MSQTVTTQMLVKHALVQAEEAHARYERDELGGRRDEDWAGWYAAYVVEVLGDQGYVLYQP